MRLFICPSGERERRLRALCLTGGHSLPEHGPWDAVVLELPRSFMFQELSDQLPRGQKIVCGITDGAFDALAEKRGWKLYRVLKDEAFTLENAEWTAEGAVWALMNRLPRALKSCRFLVTGYGRVGKAVTHDLRALGANVTVAARKEAARKEAGENSVPTEEIPRVISQMDGVINTVPAKVLTREALSGLRKDALLLELASAPYGVDMEQAKKLGIPVYIESGLPGRYCPESAAATVLKYVERVGKDE